MNPTSSNSGQVRVRLIDWEKLNKKIAPRLSEEPNVLFQRTHPISLKTAIIEANIQEELYCI